MSLSRERCLPNFLGIGAQKCGTTTLHQILNLQEKIFLPREKELHYFTKYYDKPLSWYNEFFKAGRDKEVKGEITPYYLYHESAAQRIAKDLPNVKLIILLRNPIERTISQYNHSRRLGYEQLNIEEALQKESQRLKSGGEYSHQKHSYLSRSKYNLQIKRYEQYFNKNQILILKSENFFKLEAECLTSISNFLNIGQIQLPMNQIRANSNENITKNVDIRVREWIKEELREETKKLGRFNIYWDDI